MKTKKLLIEIPWDVYQQLVKMKAEGLIASWTDAVLKGLYLLFKLYR